VEDHDSQQVLGALRDWWREQSQSKGTRAASSLLLRELWDFVRDSTPERRRSRFGDMEYDWEHRVETTSGTVGWRERLLGVFHSAYQPTDEAAFREMMAALPIDFREFTFIDIGSGKGRVLLMASEYPFRSIVGVELMEELHRTAEENIAAYRQQRDSANGAQSGPSAQIPIESIRADAREFIFPQTPLVIYLFNPLPEAGLRRMLHNLENSYSQTPRPIWIVYHNPVLEHVFTESHILVKRSGRREHSVFEFRRVE
jgi:Histone methylation protein DOT1